MNPTQYEEIRDVLSRIEAKLNQVFGLLGYPELIGKKEPLSPQRELVVGSKVYATEETAYSVQGEWGVVIHPTDSYVRVIYANGGLVVYPREGIDKKIENSGLVVDELREYKWVNFAQTMEDWRNKVFDVAILHPRLS